MEKSDIKLNLRIEIPQKHRFNDVDICVILGNCLDNSIEAVCKLDDVSKREVNVDLVYRKKGLLIRISNPFSGDIKRIIMEIWSQQKQIKKIMEWAYAL